MLTTMSWPERASWLCWIWLSYALVLAIGRGRRAEFQEEKDARDWKATPALIS
jgi:hypothetical protein